MEVPDRVAVEVVVRGARRLQEEANLEVVPHAGAFGQVVLLDLAADGVAVADDLADLLRQLDADVLADLERGGAVGGAISRDFVGRCVIGRPVAAACEQGGEGECGSAQERNAHQFVLPVAKGTNILAHKYIYVKFNI